MATQILLAQRRGGGVQEGGRRIMTVSAGRGLTVGAGGRLRHEWDA